jgi:hypothetical protein
MQYLWHQPPPHNSDPEEAAEAEKEDADVCAICLEVPGTGTKNITVTACGHKFCTTCLLSSLRQKNTCPTCRAVLEPARAYVTPLSVSAATDLIRDEERITDMRRRINIINAFAGTSGRASMMFSLCREFAFNVAHGIARWQKNQTDDTDDTDDTYHPSWENFDDSDGESESESD